MRPLTEGRPGIPPPPSLEKKPDEFDHFPNSSPRKKGELERGNDFSSSPFALLRECVCVRSLKNQGSVVVRREEREFNFAAVGFFFHGQKNEPKISHPDPRGEKARKLHTPLSLLNARKCSEGKIRLLYTGKTNRRRRRVLGQNDRENSLTSWGLRPPPVNLFQRGKENDDDVLILHSLSQSDSPAQGWRSEVTRWRGRDS